MKRTKLLTIVIIQLLTSLHLMAQTDPVFKLEKDNGHFFLQTTVNGIDAHMMLESGVPGLMMSEAFYEAHKDSLKMELTPCAERIRYLHGMHNVKFTGHARLRVGDALFDGPVKVADGDHKLLLPINMLRHASDNSSIVRLDLANNEISVCSRAHLPELIDGATALDLTFNKWLMPVVSTVLSMNVEGQRVNLPGSFIVDMGNGSLLFLNKSQASVVKALADGKVNLKQAYDKNGKVVAEGIFAEQLIICGRTYHSVSVGVSQFKSLEECGFLGLKFFTMPAVFDFDHHKMYLCR